MCFHALVVVLAMTYIIQNAHESFVNLDSNVLKSLIDLKAIVDGSKVHIIVTNTKVGMDMEVLHRLSFFIPLGSYRFKQNSSGWGMSQ